MLLRIFLILLLSAALADAGIIMRGTGGGGGEECIAEYGAELHVAANAAVPSASDTDATTGWTGTGLAVWDSIDTSPQLGTYHFTAVSNSVIDRFYINLSTLSTGTIYRLSAYARHNGTGGDWIMGLSDFNTGVSGNPGYVILTNSDTTYAQFDRYFTAGLAGLYFIANENSATDDGGIYFDNFSLKEVTTACFGAELNTASEATSLTNETNATTGWTSANCDTFGSVDTGTPQNGSYHIVASSNGTPTNAAKVYRDIGTEFSLQNGTRYFVLFHIKHVGSGDEWAVGLSGDNTMTGDLKTLYVDPSMTTYMPVGFEIIYDSTRMRYLVAQEYNSPNTGGVYIDSLSIKEVNSR